MVGIVGYGHVGKAMEKLFKDAVIYDLKLGIGSKEAINSCNIAFVCVPTPMASDGSCDTTCVDDVLSWLESNVVVIRSTVPVGYTKIKSMELKKRIVFQPEYFGETVNHPFADLNNREWIVLGGNKSDVKLVIKEYQKVYTANIKIIKTDSDTAELAKYMENAFLAVKVSFCNEFYDIAAAYGIDYDQLREIWLMDPRINRSHTFVYDDHRGYGGSCLPKDMFAIQSIATKAGVSCEIIDASIMKNKKYQQE